MLQKPYYYLDEAAEILSEKTGLKITQDDLINKAIETKLFLHISAFQWLVTYDKKPPFRFDGYCGIESSDLKSALQTEKKRMPFYVSNIPIKTSELAKFGIFNDLDFTLLSPAEACSCRLDFTDLVVSHDAILDFIEFHCPEIKDKNLNTSSPSLEPFQPDNIFKKNQTGTWEFRFNGESYLPIAGLKGFTYIQQLLKNPNKNISTITLSSLFSELSNNDNSETTYLNEQLSITDNSDAGEVFDKRALIQYQARIIELEELTQEAIEMGNLIEAEKLEYELEVLITEIKKGTDNKKRIKKDLSSTRKISDGVTRNIKNSLKKMDDESPELAKYLRKNIDTGTECIYTDTSVSWFFE